MAAAKDISLPDVPKKGAKLADWIKWGLQVAAVIAAVIAAWKAEETKQVLIPLQAQLQAK